MSLPGGSGLLLFLLFCVRASTATETSSEAEPSPEVVTKSINHRFLGFGSECGHNSSHNSFFGAPGPQDELLYFRHIIREYKAFLKLDVDVDIPASTEKPEGVISYIEILDQFTNGNGGCATVTSGGVGSTHVSIHFNSKRFRGMNFIVNVYGRKF